MPRVIGLRSPHAKVGRIVHFGRLLDKARLQARAELPPDYHSNLGEGMDGRCCRFLGVGYADLRGRTLEGGCDEEILAWAHGRGQPRGDEECVVWNRFVTKMGWRDDRSDALAERTREYGLTVAPQTFCELFDADEGRPLGATRSWEGPAIGAIVVMGVSGCGKSTVGRALAAALAWAYVEGDDLHPPANVAKMKAGIPLDDTDRAPWLAAVARAIAEALARGRRVVVACSALKHAYRQVLAPDPGPVRFVYLRGRYEVLRQRMEARSGHFMKEAMLKSQLETLEEPVSALAVDIETSPAALTDRIRQLLVPL